MIALRFIGPIVNMTKAIETLGICGHVITRDNKCFVVHRS
jgi:hypothetical protein